MFTIQSHPHGILMCFCLFALGLACQDYAAYLLRRYKLAGQELPFIGRVVFNSLLVLAVLILMAVFYVLYLTVTLD